MKVSVLIRAFNSEATLARAVQSACSQDIAPGDLEILVIDDGSTDSSASIVSSLADARIRVIRQEHAGAIAAANAGVRAARGELIMLLDADDEMLQGAARAAIAALDDTTYDFAYGGYIEEFAQKKIPMEPRDPFDAPAGAFAWRRESLLAAGCFDDDMLFPEYDLLLRMWQRWKSTRISGPIFVYHRRAASLSGDKAAVGDAMQRLLLKYPERASEINSIRSYALPV